MPACRLAAFAKFDIFVAGKEDRRLVVALIELRNKNKAAVLVVLSSFFRMSIHSGAEPRREKL